MASAHAVTLALFEDESEALTHPYLAHAWVKRGADLCVEAPGQARKVAVDGAFGLVVSYGCFVTLRHVPPPS